MTIICNHPNISGIVIVVVVCVGGYWIYRGYCKGKPSTIKFKVEQENSDGSKTKVEVEFTGTAATLKNMNQFMDQVPKIMSCQPCKERKNRQNA
jgi:hypothetical protein